MARRSRLRKVLIVVALLIGALAGAAFVTTGRFAAGVKLVVPRPGEQVDPAHPRPIETWWR